MLPESFLDLIKERNLIRPGDSLLLAVSGGMDSVVLVDLVARMSYPFAIAHCNFELRGNESDQDEEFVRSLAARHGVDFFVQHFNTKYYAAKGGVSTQMAARSLRYTWFERVRKQEKMTRIVTAHHLSDSLETALINFIRGSGVRGLRGIKASSGKVIRPLLTTTREAIESYARENELQWREDSSNQQDVYTRNYIRQHIIPEMKKLNPAIEESYDITSRRLRDADLLIMEKAERIMRDHASRHGKDWFISRKALLPANLSVAEEVFRPFGLNVYQVMDLLSHLPEKGGSQLFLSESHQVNLDRKYVIVSERENETPEDVVIDQPQSTVSHYLGTFTFREARYTGFFHRNPEAITVDADMLEYPVTIRKWREGDTFRPLGMQGKKKISDFMIDAKIPLNLKERVCVMESGGCIFWVIGYRLDERFKARPETQRVVHISLENDQSF